MLIFFLISEISLSLCIEATKFVSLDFNIVSILSISVDYGNLSKLLGFPDTADNKPSISYFYTFVLVFKVLLKSSSSDESCSSNVFNVSNSFIGFSNI